MKKETFRTVATLSLFLLLAVASVHAQSSQRVVADIPFDFVASDRTLPAGRYTIKRTTNISGAMEINGDGTGTLCLMRATESSQPRNRTELVFHRYGEKYFLAEVWKSGENSGVRLQTSRAERSLKSEMAKNASSDQTAKNTVETVVVALIASK